MSDSPAPDKDALEDLLAFGTPPAAEDAWRQALFLRTAGVLRRRRWCKSAGLAAALAACYLAGLGTMRLCVPPAPVVNYQVEAPRPAEGDKPEEATSGTRLAGPLARQQPSVPADVLERWAPSVSEEKPAELYRRIGDRYLKEGGDVQAALRCYAQSLENSSEEELTAAPEDDFLLMALKDARQKEKRHANDGG